VKGPLALFLPFTRDPARDWADLSMLDSFDYVFMHQTVNGSIASTGEHLSGEELPDIFDGVAHIYSGDIHVPQRVKIPGNVVDYVGSPYHVHFGDNFKPRVVLLETPGRAVDLHIPNMPRRVTIAARSIREYADHIKALREGDQLKVRLELQPEERYEWARLRREATDLAKWIGLQPYGIELVAVGGDGRRVTHDRAKRLAHLSPEEALQRYVEDEDLGGDALQAGMELL
jgi:hypothetical protein